MSEYVSSPDARRLRHARNTVRHHLERMASYPDARRAVEKARYERACALLATHKLSGAKIRHDWRSTPILINEETCGCWSESVSQDVAWPSPAVASGQDVA